MTAAASRACWRCKVTIASANSLSSSVSGSTSSRPSIAAVSNAAIWLDAPRSTDPNIRSIIALKIGSDQTPIHDCSVRAVGPFPDGDMAAAVGGEGLAVPVGPNARPYDMPAICAMRSRIRYGARSYSSKPKCVRVRANRWMVSPTKGAEARECRPRSRSSRRAQTGGDVGKQTICSASADRPRACGGDGWRWPSRHRTGGERAGECAYQAVEVVAASVALRPSR